MSYLPQRNLQYCISMCSALIEEHNVDRIETILGSWGEVKGRVRSQSSENRCESGSHVLKTTVFLTSLPEKMTFPDL